MVITLDRRLMALSEAAIIPSSEEGGCMVFSPNPVIAASDSEVLAHEICHVMGGRRDYEIFETAVIARNNVVFNYVLNLLYDWFHEYHHGRKYSVIQSYLDILHKRVPPQKPTGEQEIDKLWRVYEARTINPASLGINDAVDLVAYADKVVGKLKSQDTVIANLGLCGDAHVHGDACEDRNNWRKGSGASGISDIGIQPSRSNSYYIKTISKYRQVIEALSNLWIRNKISNKKNYYGEIDWKNLVGMFAGEKLSLPIWNQWFKNIIDRKIYLAVDRSGSTYSIENTIMDTAVIIAESLRMNNVPISILDIGVTNDIINSIDDPIDTSWFTPHAGGGTPIGEVCHKIKDSDETSYLLIITDGCPDNWNTLLSAIRAFKGDNLTFVIGDSFNQYAKFVRNTLRVEPHTIVKTLINTDALS